MSSYVISGLRVESDLTLPGAIQASEPDLPHDVIIVAGDVPVRLSDPAESGPNWDIAGDRFLLRVPGIVRLLIDGGRQITWQCEGQAAPDEVAIFVSGSGFGLLMHQRGHCVLHASAVAVGNSAVLFCGPSGAGKSTIAAMLGSRGYPLLSDDQCVLSGIESGHPVVHADGRALKLWRQSIDELALAERSGAAVRAQLQKFFVDPATSHAAPLTLSAICVLQEATAVHLAAGGEQVALESLNLADAAKVVRQNAFRPAMVRRLGQEALYLQAAAAIAGAGRVYRLVRPLDFAQNDAVVAALEQSWRKLGLLEAGD